VYLKLWNARHGVRQIEQHGSTRELAEGWFELHFDRALADVSLLAEAGSRGTGFLPGMLLSLSAPPQDLEIVLRGEGALQGRVLEASGEPASSVDLLILLAELDDGRGSFVLPEPQHSLRESEGLGRCWVTVSTAEDGSFAAPGLRSEMYVVRARRKDDTRRGYPLLLTPTPVLAREAEVELRFAPPELVVRLVDADGLPLPGARASFGFDASGRPLSSWPAEPNVRVFACDSPTAPWMAGEVRTVKRSSPSELLFEVHDGQRYLVSVLGPGFDGRLKEIDVPVGAATVTLVVAATEADAPATLIARVLSAGMESRGRFLLTLEREDAALPLLNIDSGRSTAPFLMEVPAGSYRLVAAGQTNARALGRAEVELVLLPGRVQDVELELSEGGNLEVTVEGEATDADLRATRVANTWSGRRNAEFDAWLAGRAAKAELRLIDTLQRSEPVYFIKGGGEETTARAPRLSSECSLGATAVSEMLPCGRFTLLGRLPGGREARASVELVAGETTAVQLSFAP